MNPSPLVDPARLADHLVRVIPGFAGPVTVTGFTTGQSNPTFRLDTPGGSFVLRRKPPGVLLKSAHAIEREYRVQRALAGSAVPVPEMLHLCEDDSLIGSPFYVMRLVPGRSFTDPALPDLAPGERAALYDAMNAALAALHAIDLEAAGLGDYGAPGDYISRQTDRWTRQYRQSETGEEPDMERLIAWLAANRLPPDDTRTLVHGDWRIDNMIFAADGPGLAAVLDWELSTTGHPVADLAYQVMQWRLPPGEDTRGLAGLDRARLGLPSDADYVAAYCARRGLPDLPDFPVFLAFSFFRMAAILQGVKRRSLDGNGANPERGMRMGALVPLYARLGLEAVHAG
ncbi:phosphotransferase [Microvirga tunisiensis]|uniref:Phosphotransferase n=1 Tax=Pannonibacter tanglangensis TaxID=2750084 RepID=A0A7X5F4J4_9HYPH|nr:phosphotransferase family protein [Pannonibacter sp. XCT-53]NBN78640.1 phosphotransferase [Pannonibacter sp. XCT-53]